MLPWSHVAPALPLLVQLRNDLLAEIHAAGQVHEQLLQSEKIKAILQQLNFGEASLNAAACTPVPVLDMAQAVQGTAAMGIKTPRTDSNGSTPAPGGSEGRAGTQDNDEGRQGSSRRKQGKSRSRRLGSPRTAALRNASQEVSEAGKGR